jgi:hypothetical protein
MKIYTYYENVGFNLQEEMIKIWKQSWLNNGFEPIVLTRKDAESSSLYQKYYEFIQRIHKNISGKILPENSYHLAAQLSIVAFTTIDKKKPAYISDYDVINKNFQYKDKSVKLHWRDECCSCFASGNGEGWISYVNFLFSEEKTITDWCLNEKLKTKREYFHDQDFLIAIKNQGLEKNIYNMSRKPHLCQKYFPAVTYEQTQIKLYHISHENVIDLIGVYKQCHHLCNPNNDNYNQKTNYETEEIRCKIANRIIQHNTQD